MRDDLSEVVKRYEKAFYQIVLLCGEEASVDSWRALSFPDKDVYAIESVRQLRADYDDALAEALGG